jgi:hypothetical protein
MSRGAPRFAYGKHMDQCFFSAGLNERLHNRAALSQAANVENFTGHFANFWSDNSLLLELIEQLPAPLP